MISLSGNDLNPNPEYEWRWLVPVRREFKSYDSTCIAYRIHSIVRQRISIWRGLCSFKPLTHGWYNVRLLQLVIFIRIWEFYWNIAWFCGIANCKFLAKVLSMRMQLHSAPCIIIICNFLKWTDWACILHDIVSTPSFWQGSWQEISLKVNDEKKNSVLEVAPELGNCNIRRIWLHKRTEIALMRT